MSNSREEIYYNKITRQVRHTGSQIIFDMPFFRLNIIDKYNNGMSDIDLSDQVRNVYR